MPKTKISEYSTTNVDNSDIEGINIAEGCLPSSINNAIRELMVHLKEFQTGASGDPLTVSGSFVATGSVTMPNTASFTNVDVNGGTIDGVSIGSSVAATIANVDNLRLDGNTLSSTDTNGNIAITPNGTGEVDISKVDIDSGAIDGTTIGANSAAAGTFTTATATTGNITTVNATTVDTTNLEVTNLKAKDGTSAGSIADSTGVVTLASAVLTTADINGGTIDGAVIGGSSAAAGTFTTATATTGNITTLNATTVNTTTLDLTNLEVTNLKAKDGTSAGSIADSTGVVTLGSTVLTTTDINGGTIDGTTIGGSSAAAGTFTNLTASGTVSLSGATVSNLGSFASSVLASAVSDETGSGALVFATSPTLVTPTIGAATATSINKVNITAPATSATLTIANGKTATFSNTLTFTGTDSSSVAFGAGGTVAYTGSGLNQFAATTSAQLAGVISDETGSGALVFGTNPTISGATISGGTINNTPIGGTTRAAGNFTTLDANGNVTLGDATSDTITATGRFNTDLVPSTDNARDLGTSALKWKQVYATTFTENGYGVVSQLDLGTAPNEIPLNQYLGALAYEDTETPALDVGTGITTGTGTICRANGGAMGGIYRMTILIDLTGLNSGGTANDIIGVNGTSLPCYIARLPAMTVLGGRMTCLETPAGGDTDIDLYSATEGTGVEDQAITALTETLIINAGTQSAGTVTYFSADPAANAYFYLAGQGTSNATYTAGRFLIEIFGVQ